MRGSNSRVVVRWPMSRMGSDAGDDIRELRLRIDAIRLGVTIRLSMAAARRPPRSDPQNSQDFRPRALPLSPRSAALLDRHRRPSSRNVKLTHRFRIKCLGQVMSPRQLGELFAHII
jgi:hypothetical protein